MNWLAAEVEWFKEGSPYELSAHFDTETGDNILQLASIHQPPAKCSLAVGDCVQNFRAALDHAVWRIASATGGANARTQFPIFHDAARYAREHGKQIGGLPPDVQAVIETLQPFQNAAAAAHPLSVLHDLSNIDKHRDISIVTVIAKSSYLVVAGQRFDFADLLPAGTLPPNTVIARVPSGQLANAPAVGTTHYIGLDVVFGEPGPAAGREVTATLTEVRDAVANALNRLEPFLPAFS